MTILVGDYIRITEARDYVIAEARDEGWTVKIHLPAGTVLKVSAVSVGGWAGFTSYAAPDGPAMVTVYIDPEYYEVVDA